MTGGRVREHVAQLDVPPEPPAGSVVISSADGCVRQSHERGGRLHYPRRGDLFFDGLSWPQLLSYGPVEIIWRPDANMPDDSTRAAALDLLAAIDAVGATSGAPGSIALAARLLRARLVGDQVADASGAPG
jgi:hypothetical protein